jgi:hypothetical protein
MKKEYRTALQGGKFGFIGQAEIVVDYANGY